MIAAISPADYEETLSTLRYADQAKKIKNKAVVNEDPNAKLIRELKEELETLRARMAGPTLGHHAAGPSALAALESTFDDSVPPERQMVQYRTAAGEIKTISKAELQDQLAASERLMASVTETWEEKLEKTKEVQLEREKALESLGITIEKNLVGVHTPKKMPHLVNLNEDPLMTECLICPSAFFSGAPEVARSNLRTLPGRPDQDRQDDGAPKTSFLTHSPHLTRAVSGRQHGLGTARRYQAERA